MTPQLNASSRIMYEEAQKRGYDCTLFGDHETILMKTGNLSWYTRGSRTSMESSIGDTIADNKFLTKKILHHFHLPTAKSVEVRKIEQLDRVDELQFPLVMKPHNGAHGRGVVVGITDKTAAQAHFAKLNQSVLFEEMLSGIEYRIICVDYHFIAAAFRKPAHVVGDGHSTIEQLIAEKNKHPWRGEGHSNNLSLILVDELVEIYLKEQGYTVTSAPAKDVEVKLRKTANLSTGGEAWDVTDQVCAENKKLFETIARVCDLNTIGIDIMCTSLSAPIVDQPKAGIVEVNASPGLRMHHYPIQGTPRNIAGLILDMVMEYKRKLAQR